MSPLSLKYCRFCVEAKGDDELIDLALYSYLHEEIQGKLAELNASDIDFTLSILPTTICFKCRNSLNNAHEFLLKIKSSQITLNNIFFKEEAPQPNDTDNLKSERIDDDYHQLLDELVCEVHSPRSLDTDCKISISDHTMLNSEIEIEPSDKKSTSTPVESSWATYPWVCQFCDQYFSDVEELREHCRHNHYLCSFMKCADCRKSFTNYERFVKHIREHRNDLKHYCQYCNIKLEATNIKTHKQTHTKHQHICPHCGKTFQNLDRQKRHTNKFKPLKRSWFYILPTWEINDMLDKTWTGYCWTCQICNTSFKALEELRTHTKDIHKKCFSIKCLDCDEICDCYRSFVHHVRRHRPHMKQYCHYCNHQFPTKEVDSEHVAQHFSQSQKACQACGEIFPSRPELERHVAAYEPATPRNLPYLRRETPLSEDDLTCDVCGKVTKSQNALRGHKLLHTDRQRDYTCEVCGKAFYTKGALTTHGYTHEESQPEVCKICKRAFKTLTVLKQHVKTHKGEKPFECAVCQRRFRLRKQMEQHSIIHTDAMPHQCQYCEKAFRHKTNLRTHEHQHTGARPYSCTECTMTFSNWANCNKHMKRRHGVTLAKSSMTEHGKLPVNAKTGKVRVLTDVETAMEWTERILRPCRRGKKKADTRQTTTTDTVI